MDREARLSAGSDDKVRTGSWRKMKSSPEKEIGRTVGKTSEGSAVRSHQDMK